MASDSDEGAAGLSGAPGGLQEGSSGQNLATGGFGS